MKIRFLGTCGGRFAVIKQMRASGGFIVEIGEKIIHIDPGPGAIVRARQFGFNIEKVDILAISHSHPDHYTDAEIVIEAMTAGVKRKRGVLIGNKYIIEHDDEHRQLVSPYHLRTLEKYFVLRPGDKINIGKLRIEATKTMHEEKHGIGFVIDDGKERFGYTGDTKYFDGLVDYFSNCNVLVMNVMKPKNEFLEGHMNTHDAAKLISKTKPGIAIIQHFGMSMLFSNPEKEARWIESETKVRTIAARDNMSLDTKKETGGKSLERWL
ncbi:MAG TPA: MBL fold metallo-hydrolase [Candidatus Aenigmarchaeota archaeon]|nr:MAG: MBL fold metallo-hydrolase [Candidatus Aenigmarchaeota archaeon]HDD45942.1 MBL fold metallo-hydrolase [Candidatus Aenigmarchaeota archaeon]